jgi:hypothetical protein
VHLLCCEIASDRRFLHTRQAISLDQTWCGILDATSRVRYCRHECVFVLDAPHALDQITMNDNYLVQDLTIVPKDVPTYASITNWPIDKR